MLQTEVRRRIADDGQVSLLERLLLQPPDGLLALIGAFRNDPRPGCIDVGVGVYKDAAGRTPVLRAVKTAERILLEDQPTKTYLGPEGDVGFFELLAPMVLGDAHSGRPLAGIQTPGGTGALRLAAETIAAADPQVRVLVGAPTWPNHLPIIAAAGLPTREYRYFDVATQRIDFDAMLAACRQARPRDVVLIHGCCHNPCGADLSLEQWTELGRTIADRGLLPLIDLAYQGLGDGLDDDAAGMRLLLDAVPEALIAYSCDKNFGLYRERVGALFAIGADAATARSVQSNLLALARANWSMPPDHGAAIVRTILERPELATDWRAELTEMRQRIQDMRRLLAAASPALSFLAGQKGMFSTLPLSPADVAVLRERSAVYMAGSGRINIAGITPDHAAAFAAAVSPFLRLRSQDAEDVN